MRKVLVLKYSDSYISVGELKEYAYCPVIPWIHKYLGFYTEPTESMSVAKDFMDSNFKEKVAEELKLPKPWRFEVPLKSKELGLRGTIDILAGKRRYIVVEVKYYKRKRSRIRHFKLQLLAYALLVSKTLGSVKEAILYNGGDVIKVPVTQDVLDEVVRQISRLKRILKSEEPPKANQNPSKCLYCWYRHVCPLV